MSYGTVISQIASLPSRAERAWGMEGGFDLCTWAWGKPGRRGRDASRATVDLGACS